MPVIAFKAADENRNQWLHLEGGLEAFIHLKAFVPTCSPTLSEEKNVKVSQFWFWINFWIPSSWNAFCPISAPYKKLSGAMTKSNYKQTTTIRSSAKDVRGPQNHQAYPDQTEQPRKIRVIGQQWRNRWWGEGQGEECPSRDFWLGNFCWCIGKREARKIGKKEQKKKGKLKKGRWKIENGRRKSYKKRWGFFFFFFYFSLFKTTEICFGVYTKMEIFYREKAFHARKKIRKNDFAPSEKFACYFPVGQYLA